MAMSTDPRFPDTISRGVCKIQNADGTTVKDIVTAGTDGARLDHFFISSNDSASMDVTLYLNDGTNDIWLGTVNVPALSGSDTTSRTIINLMDSTKIMCIDLDNKFFMKAGDKLRASVVSAVTAGKTVYVTAIVGDY